MSKLTLTQAVSKTDYYSNAGITHRHYDVKARVTVGDGEVKEIMEGVVTLKGGDAAVASFVKPKQYNGQSPTITFPGDPSTQVMRDAMSDIADYIDAVEEMVAGENVTE